MLLTEPPPLPRFGLHAERYREHRLAYSTDMFSAMLGVVGHDKHLAIDLGAGTGQATGTLLDNFDRVVAVEPDAEMAALIPNHDHLDVWVERAEDAICPPGSVDAVVAATAYHWMDQDLIARKVFNWLRPGGVFLAFAYDVVGWKPAPVQGLVHRRHGDWKSCMHARLTSNYDYAEVLQAVDLYEDVQALRAVIEQTMTPESAAGFLMTTSYASLYARRTSDEASYEVKLADDIKTAARGQKIVARFPMVGALAVKAA